MYRTAAVPPLIGSFMRYPLLFGVALLAAHCAAAAPAPRHPAAATASMAVAASAATAAVVSVHFSSVPSRAPGSRIRFDDGSIFHADYMADFWSRPDAPARGATPSRDAPGNVMRTIGRFGGKQDQPGAAAMRRKLDAVLPRLLAHPALAGIRGASVRPGGYFGHQRGGPMGHAIPGRTTLTVYPVNLDDPLTRAYPDGTFHTPGEGAGLRVIVNDTDELARRAPRGTWRGMTVLRDGFMLVVPNTDRPLYVATPDGGQVMNPDLIDTSRPRSDIQFMVIEVGTSSSEHSEIVHGRVAPAGETGRLVGVLYNTDWRAFLAEIDAIR